MIIATHEERLRRLVLHDEGCIQSMLGIHLSGNDGPSLDPKIQALVRLGGLVAMGAAPVSTIGPPKRPWTRGRLPRRLSAPWSRWRPSAGSHG
jgi:hypothetical protein